MGGHYNQAAEQVKQELTNLALDQLKSGKPASDSNAASVFTDPKQELAAMQYLEQQIINKKPSDNSDFPTQESSNSVKKVHQSHSRRMAEAM